MKGVPGGPSVQDLFSPVLAHTMRSFRGGNRERACHRTLGLDHPRVAGKNVHPEA
jgi:hypothetical protein